MQLALNVMPVDYINVLETENHKVFDSALGSLIFVTICDNVERRGNGNTLKVSVKIKNIPFIL